MRLRGLLLSGPGWGDCRRRRRRSGPMKSGPRYDLLYLCPEPGLFSASKRTHRGLFALPHIPEIPVVPLCTGLCKSRIH